MKDLVKEKILSLKAYQVCKEPMVAKLDANENPYNLFKQLQDQYIQNILKIDINRYPDTDSDDLRREIGGLIGLEKKNIMCGNGSDELIKIIIETFVDKDDCVIIHTPTFGMYKVFTTIAGGQVVEIQSDADFAVKTDEIIQQANARKAKLIFLCNPNNPTGNVIPKKDILKILQSTESVVVVDEAYYEFLEETVIEEVLKSNRLIVLRTLSKAFALAGARIGYAAAHESLMDILYCVKPPYNLNVFSQILGEIMLQNQELVAKSVIKIKHEKTKLLERLNGIQNITIFPSGSNFILIKSPKADCIMKAAFTEGIALRGFESEGLLKDCIRITVGSSEENERFVSLLEKVV
ncbi:MAG: histidinol-phosphate transaminase [Bacillota bacterium]